MKKWIIASLSLIVAGVSHADVTQRLNIATPDLTCNAYPYKAIFSNGSCTDNGDGTVTITTGGGSSSSSGTIVASPQHQITFYPIAGSTNTVSGDPNFNDYVSSLSYSGHQGILMTQPMSQPPSYFVLNSTFAIPLLGSDQANVLKFEENGISIGSLGFAYSDISGPYGINILDINGNQMALFKTSTQGIELDNPVTIGTANASGTAGLTVSTGIAIVGPGDGTITLTISGSTYTATSSSVTSPTAGHMATWSGQNTLVDGGAPGAGGGSPGGSNSQVQLNSGGTSFGGSNITVDASSATFGGSAYIKGPNPWVDITAYGVKENAQTTCSAVGHGNQNISGLTGISNFGQYLGQTIEVAGAKNFTQQSTSTVYATIISSDSTSVTYGGSAVSPNTNTLCVAMGHDDAPNWQTAINAMVGSSGELLAPVINQGVSLIGQQTLTASLISTGSTGGFTGSSVTATVASNPTLSGMGIGSFITISGCSAGGGSAASYNTASTQNPFMITALSTSAPWTITWGDPVAPTTYCTNGTIAMSGFGAPTGTAIKVVGPGATSHLTSTQNPLRLISMMPGNPIMTIGQRSQRTGTTPAGSLGPIVDGLSFEDASHAGAVTAGLRIIESFDGQFDNDGFYNFDGVYPIGTTGANFLSMGLWLDATWAGGDKAQGVFTSYADNEANEVKSPVCIGNSVCVDAAQTNGASQDGPNITGYPYIIVDNALNPYATLPPVVAGSSITAIGINAYGPLKFHGGVLQLGSGNVNDSGIGILEHSGIAQIEDVRMEYHGGILPTAYTGIYENAGNGTKITNLSGQNIGSIARDSTGRYVTVTMANGQINPFYPGQNIKLQGFQKEPYSDCDFNTQQGGDGGSAQVLSSYMVANGSFTIYQPCEGGAGDSITNPGSVAGSTATVLGSAGATNDIGSLSILNTAVGIEIDTGSANNYSKLLPGPCGNVSQCYVDHGSGNDWLNNSASTASPTMVTTFQNANSVNPVSFVNLNGNGLFIDTHTNVNSSYGFVGSTMSLSDDLVLFSTGTPPTVTNASVLYESLSDNVPNFVPPSGSAYDINGSSQTSGITIGHVLVYSSTNGATIDGGVNGGQGNAILNQSTLQTGATAFPDFLEVNSSMTIYGTSVLHTTMTILGVSSATFSNVSSMTLTGSYFDVSASTSNLGIVTLNGVSGASGQLLESQGSGSTATWITAISSVAAGTVGPQQITTVNASQINAGSLGASVVASSVAAGTVGPQQTTGLPLLSISNTWANIGIFANGIQTTASGGAAYEVKLATSVTSTNYIMDVSTQGHIDTLPVYVATATSCGTAPALSTNCDDTACTVTPGSGAPGACTFTFAKAYTNTPVCIVQLETGSVTNTFTYTVSASAITATETGIGKFDIHCWGKD
jgi:hypothetical protein